MVDASLVNFVLLNVICYLFLELVKQINRVGRSKYSPSRLWFRISFPNKVVHAAVIRIARDRSLKCTAMLNGFSANASILCNLRRELKPTNLSFSCGDVVNFADFWDIVTGQVWIDILHLVYNFRCSKQKMLLCEVSH